MEGMLTLKGIDEALGNLPRSNRASLRYELLMAIREVYQNDDDLARMEGISRESLIKRVWDVGNDPKQMKAKRKNLSSLKSSLNQSFKKLSNEGKNPEGVKIGRENTFVLSDDRKNKLIQTLGTNIKENESLHNMVKAFRQALSQVNPDIASGDYEAALEELEKTKELLSGLSEKIDIGDQSDGMSQGVDSLGGRGEGEGVVKRAGTSFSSGELETGEGLEENEEGEPGVIGAGEGSEGEKGVDAIAGVDALDDPEDVEETDEVAEEVETLEIAEELNNIDDADEVMEEDAEEVELAEEGEEIDELKEMEVVDEIEETDELEEEDVEDLEFAGDVADIEEEVYEEVEIAEQGEEADDFEEAEELEVIEDMEGVEEEKEILGGAEIHGVGDGENINAAGKAGQIEGVGKGEGTGREEKDFGDGLATDNLSVLKQILRKLSENVQSSNYRTVMDELDQLKRMISDISNQGENGAEEKNLRDIAEGIEEVDEEDIEVVQITDAVEEHEELEEVEDVEEVEEDIEELEIADELDEMDDVNEIEEAEEFEDVDDEEVELAEEIEEAEEEDAQEVELAEEGEEIDDLEEVEEFEEVETEEVLEDEMPVGNMENDRGEGGGSGDEPDTEDIAALGQMLRAIDDNIESGDYQKVLEELEHLKKVVSDVLSRIQNREQTVNATEGIVSNADEKRSVKGENKGDIKEIESAEELEEPFKSEEVEEVEEIDEGEICEDQVPTKGVKAGEGTSGTGKFDIDSETERLLKEFIENPSSVSNERRNPDSREFLPEGTPADEDHQNDDVLNQKFLTERFEEYLDITKRFYNRHIRIPGGNYVIGVKDPSHNEQEEKRITLRPFYLGEYPVTNALFRVFVDKTGYKTSAERVGYGEVYEAQIKKVVDQESGRESYVLSMGIMSKIVDGACWRYPFGPGSSIESKQNHPAVQISIDDARAFAAWTGKRLPSEAEWEAAARGMDARIYPWGNEWRGNNCNLESSCVGDTTPADHYQDVSRSPFDISDMLGNVFEWTTTLYAYGVEGEASRETYYVIKGGSFIDGEIRSASWRVKASEKSWSNITGFRCAV